MLPEKRKQYSPIRLDNFRGIILGGLVILIGTAILWFALEPILFPIKSETLIIPLNLDKDTFTQFHYTGVVMITISGSGQSCWAEYSDAFYIYTENNGHDSAIPQLGNGCGLEIDGQQALIALGLVDNPPPYNPEHSYLVQYEMEYPRQIVFRTADHYPTGNTGELRITIRGERSPYFSNGLYR